MQAMICFVFMVVSSLGVTHASNVAEANESSSPSGSSEYVNFENDVMPVLTKAGCNDGVCHAKAGGGQNGFELSLVHQMLIIFPRLKS